MVPIYYRCWKTRRPAWEDGIFAEDKARVLAAQHELRGADAVYAAVAQQAGCTLISLDHQHLTRLGGIVMVRTPAVVLAELVPPTTASSAT